MLAMLVQKQMAKHSEVRKPLDCTSFSLCKLSLLQSGDVFGLETCEQKQRMFQQGEHPCWAGEASQENNHLTSTESLAEKSHSVRHRLGYVAERSASSDSKALEGELQSAPWWNAPRKETLCPVALMRGDNQPSVLADLHPEAAMVPSRDDLPGACLVGERYLPWVLCAPEPLSRLVHNASCVHRRRATLADADACTLFQDLCRRV